MSQEVKEATVSLIFILFVVIIWICKANASYMFWSIQHNVSLPGEYRGVAHSSKYLAVLTVNTELVTVFSINK